MNFEFKHFFKRKKNVVDDVAVVFPKSASELKTLILKTGAIIEVEDKQQYIIGFQGGKFLLSYKPTIDVLDIIYPNFEQFNHKDIGWANMAANSINAYYGGWNCYFKMAEEGEEEKPVNMSLSYRLWLTGKDNQIVHLLKNVLSDSFNISREFTDRLHKSIQENVDLEKLYTVHDFDNKIAFIQNQVRMGHDGNMRSEEEWKSDNKIPLSSLFDLYVDEEFGELQDMRLLCGDEIEKISDKESIPQFDICDFIRQNHSLKDLREILLFVRYEYGSVYFSLNKTSGCTDKTLYYQMQYLKSTTTFVEDYAEHAPVKGSVLMEVRLSTEKEDYWEAKYMIDEVKERQESAPERLSTEDRAILSFIDLDLSSDYYWGRKFFNDTCYFQSLRYFLKIQRGLTSVWQDLSDEQRDAYYDVCYFIGFIYMRLLMYDKAYYYLDAARTSNSISTAQEFINCSCNMNDPKAISVIQGYMKQVREIWEDEEGEPAESLVDFNRFLLRRLAYMYVNQGNLDEAEDLLNRMIKNGDSTEFAQDELQYIQRLRAQDELRKKISREKKSNDSPHS